MRAVDIIRKKRDGLELSDQETASFIEQFCNGLIPDYQMSAFLMAAFFSGLNPVETAGLTRAMINSGSQLDFSDFEGIKVDKHSTGGVGDKVSLIVAPIVASLGAIVPMMSGRGLGHTGGTLDKLESIPGFRVTFNKREMDHIIEHCGYVMMGQTEDIVPADKRMYALRDVTATVESIPLITASILSKKYAEGTNGLVMDLKCGSGAFMKNPGQARNLAGSLLDTGTQLGLDIRVLVTDMNQPLGTTIGNLLEVYESVLALQGNMSRDIEDVCMAVSANMLLLAGLTDSLDKGIEMARQAIDSGDAFNCFCKNVELQGGDLSFVNSDSIKKELNGISHTVEVKAAGSGWIKRIDAFKTGYAAMLMGAGRATLTDTIDYLCGIEVLKKVGDQVNCGEPILLLHYNNGEQIDKVLELCNSAIEISDSEFKAHKVLLEEISC